MKRVSSLELSHHAVEVEKEDLLQAYRTLIQEKRKIERDMEALGELKQKSTMEAQSHMEQVSELRGVVEFHSNAGTCHIVQNVTFLLVGSDLDLPRLIAIKYTRPMDQCSYPQPPHPTISPLYLLCKQSPGGCLRKLAFQNS